MFIIMYKYISQIKHKTLYTVSNILESSEKYAKIQHFYKIDL